MRADIRAVLTAVVLAGAITAALAAKPCQALEANDPSLGHRTCDPRARASATTTSTDALVDVNSFVINGFGDGPTPWPPRPQPPKPTPTDPGVSTITADEAVYAYAKGATWWTRRAADGALVFHDCADPARIESALAAAPLDRVEAVKAMATESAAMKTAFAPLLDPFRAGISLATPISDVNEAWAALVAAHAEEIAVTVMGSATVAAPVTVTTGRCDGCTTTTCCPTGHICDCQTFSLAAGDCFPPRLACNTDEPPTTKPKTVKWNY